MHLGIRGMLAIGLAGLLATAGVVAAMLVGHFLEQETSEQVERQQRLRALEVAARLELSCRDGGPACEAAARAITGRAADELEELTLLDARLGFRGGLPLPCAQRDPLVAAAFQARHLQSELRPAGPTTCAEVPDAERHVVVVPFEGAGEERLVARFGFDRADLHATVATRRRTVLLALLADFAAVLLFGIYLVGRGVAKPLQALTRLTDRIVERGLEAAPDPRAAVARGPDELQRLGRAYGAMLDRLRTQDVELRDRLTELTAARDDLVRSEKLATVGRLAAGIAHEVGNPLTAVLGFVEFLRDPRTEDPALRRDLLERTDRELHRIRATIRELLDFSRPQAARPRAVNVAEAVEAALGLVRYQPRFKTLNVVVTPAVATAPPVTVDPDRLRQVLVNLLLNAADALSGQGTVVLDAGAGENGPWLRVSDDGPGIPPEARARVFDPFVSTKPAGEGTGLGLAICQRLIEEAGGRISVAENENGRGACFEIRLPAAALDG
ncbi:ATP-binding protein [Myxococcota bacterium]|nr:ATP-binding protein [Myxococcota bacterium]